MGGMCGCMAGKQLMHWMMHHSTDRPNSTPTMITRLLLPMPSHTFFADILDACAVVALEGA
jgi:hypothetical protein